MNISRVTVVVYRHNGITESITAHATEARGLERWRALARQIVGDEAKGANDEELEAKLHDNRDGYEVESHTVTIKL